MRCSIKNIVLFSLLAYALWIIFGPAGMLHTRYEYIHRINTQLGECAVESPNFWECAEDVSINRMLVRQDMQEWSQLPVGLISKYLDKGIRDTGYYAQKYAQNLSCSLKDATCTKKVYLMMYNKAKTHRDALTLTTSFVHKSLQKGRVFIALSTIGMFIFC